jgi:hypothetical protein
VQCLLSKYKVLSSNPSATKTKQGLHRKKGTSILGDIAIAQREDFFFKIKEDGKEWNLLSIFYEPSQIDI